MLLGVISDTHDKLARTHVAVQMLQAAGAQALVHCGDFVEPELLAVCAGQPVYFVLGNNDLDSASALETMGDAIDATFLGWGGVVELAGKRIGVTHGHTLSDYKRVLAARPNYLLLGHSHVAEDRRIGEVRLINPGALHRAHPYSVALLNLATDELKFLEVPK
jgi:putative phosphoesterase